MTNRRLVWTVVGVVALGIVAGLTYKRLWSPAARARQAATAFVAAAVDGDVAGVRAVLADKARVTEAAAVDLVRPFVHVQVSDVRPIRNGSRLHFAGIVVGYYANGVPQGLNMLISFEHGRWVVVDAGHHGITVE